MHSMLHRLNSVVCFGGVVLLVAVLCNHLTSFYLKEQPVIDFQFKETLSLVQMPERRYHRYGLAYPAGDEAWLSFDLVADFRPLWNWNTKQIFLYISAEYETAKYEKNNVVFWDMIIQRKEDSVFNLTNEASEYPLIDISKEFRNKPVKFTLSYHETPIAGALLWNTPVEQKVVLPDSYFRSK
eukprot:TRINITY_DN10424_c0_g1_i1.p1 TRINITY_DN10424_c0_g1~~TRINITY_DN10424_c0_g1_i1.p1  ORF type:complete len:192 (-),score=21.81 TRINITY_DN10424_c0_g1_i1:27-575(-)